eukprot:GHVU01105720.1.p1 GENE.GHVU01105720.1~~GHVU01105720.1.p1  ORF type:complete len:162 (+),score=19.27 GHVU01105720.1:214-699(+)
MNRDQTNIHIRPLLRVSREFLTRTFRMFVDVGADLDNINKEPLWKEIVSGFMGPVPFLLIITALLAVTCPDDEGKVDWFGFLLLLIETVMVYLCGFFSARKAEQYMDEVKHRENKSTVCRRDSVWKTIRLSDIVVNDLIRLVQGSIIPADGRLVDNPKMGL